MKVRRTGTTPPLDVHPQAPEAAKTASPRPDVAKAPPKTARTARIRAGAGVDPAQARSNVAQALRAAPYIESHPAIESACARAAGSARANEHLDTDGLVATAVQASGALGLRALALALGDHLSAAGIEPERRASILDTVRQRATVGLLQARPENTRAAIERTVALWELLRLGPWTTHAYSSRFFVSNEPGLPAACKELTVQGGAVLGASGGTLEVACAARADAIVMTDVDPSVCLFLHCLAALLLVVDDTATAKGWSDTQRTDEVVRLLRDRSAAIAALSAAGVGPEDITPFMRLLDQPILEVYAKPNWLFGPDRVENVAHLTRLARMGKIVAVEANLEDPLLGDRLKLVLETFGLEVSAINFSNVFDWVMNVDQARANFAKAPQCSDAMVVSTLFQNFGGRFGDWGWFERPKVSTLREWFGDNGRFAQLRTLRQTKPDMFDGGGRWDATKMAKEQVLAAARLNDGLLPPDQGRELVQRYCQLMGWDRLFAAVDAKWADKLPRAETLAQLAAQAWRYYRLFWTPKAREAMIKRELQALEKQCVQWRVLYDGPAHHATLSAAHTAAEITTLAAGLAQAIPELRRSP